MNNKTDNEIVKIFSAKACAEPLRDAAEIYEEKTGVHIEISVCSRHCASNEAEEAVGETGGDDFLLEISDAAYHDLAIGGAEFLLDDGEIRGIVKKGERRSIALRRSALIVPKGNPKDVKDLNDLTREDLGVAISVLDCLKGAWEDICGRAGILIPVRENISFYANGCVSIIESIVQHKADVAIGWSSFKHLDPDKIDVIPMTDKDSIFRGTGVGLLKFATNPEGATEFMDFLVTEEVRDIYKSYGWE